MIRNAIWLAIDTAQTLLDIAKIAAADPGRPTSTEQKAGTQRYVYIHAQTDNVREAMRHEQAKRAQHSLLYAGR